MRPSNLKFSIIDQISGGMRADIKSAHLLRATLPSEPIDYILEDGHPYEVHYERVTRIKYNKDWTWDAIVSFQIHRDQFGHLKYYALVRPFLADKPTSNSNES